MHPEDRTKRLAEAIVRLESDVVQQCLRKDGVESMLSWLLPHSLEVLEAGGVLTVLVESHGAHTVHGSGLPADVGERLADALIGADSPLPWRWMHESNGAAVDDVIVAEDRATDSIEITTARLSELAGTEVHSGAFAASRAFLVPLRTSTDSGHFRGGFVALFHDHPTGTFRIEAQRIAALFSTSLAVHEAAEVARASHAEAEAVLSAAVDSVIVIDEHGVIETCNAATERTFGWKREEVIGRNVSMLMPEPYKRSHDQYVRNYVETGQAKIIGIGREVQAVHRDGTVFPIDLSVGEIVTIRGRRRFLGLVRDISVRKQTEHQLQEARERLAHVARISTMGEMASGIAHEVNQPLTAISTYANACRRLVLDGHFDDPDLVEGLSQISEEAQRAGQIIHRLRSLVRRGQSERRPCDINALVRDVIRLAEVDTRQHDVVLDVSFGEGLPLVQADAVQVQQVVLNLIRNGTDAMDQIAKEERVVRLETKKRRENEIELTVSDRGSGLPEGIREEDLFAPFFTTKSAGMGLGLSISRSIVQSHGGRLWYSREPGGGTKFHFTLPASVGDGQGE